MVEGGGYVLYDRDGDVLFFDIGGERKEALTEPFLENIYVRIDPDTLKIEGFTVVGFQHNFLPHNRLFRLALEAYMPDILAGKALHFEGEPARLVAHMFLAAASHTAR
ncbi:MAG: hypothetical protein HY330_02270 [Chloroflexi bacterium]|nr:hypothetical protein [Chloroflexota bacterium]